MMFTTTKPSASLFITLVGLTGLVAAALSDPLAASASLASRRQLAGHPGARDFHLGFPQPGSSLVRRVIVRTSNGTAIQNIGTAGPIAFVEARDQTNGTGGYVHYYRGGVQDTVVHLRFRAVAGAVADIHFVVDVWAYPSSTDVAVAEFRRGEMNDRTTLSLHTVFDYEGREGETIWTGFSLTGSDKEKFTYIETFDLSADENGGYVVQGMQGDFGNSSFHRLNVRAAGDNMPMNIGVALYVETRENGGSPFRLGTYRGGLKFLGSAYLILDAVEGERVTGTVQLTERNGSIEFVQAKDSVANGTGELVEISSGGLNSDHMTLVIRSGVGERLWFRFDMFGIRNA